MTDLKEDEIEDATFALGIYESEKGKMDAFFLADVVRGMNYNPSLDTLEKLGWQKKKGVKFITVAELLPIISQLKKEKKDQGCYEDFVECLKLYDKEENGKMLVGELSHSLLSLGERLNDAQVDELFEDCLPEEDDEGMIDYQPFLQKMCDKK